MKKLQVVLLSLILSTGFVSTTHAAIASIATLGGAYGVGLKYALVGLGWVYAGKSFENSSKKLGLIGIVTGAILLDEKSEKITFSTIEVEEAKKAGLTASEVIAYNSEIEEINMVFDEVVSIIAKQPSEKIAVDVWTEYQEALSIDAFTALKKLVK